MKIVDSPDGLTTREYMRDVSGKYLGGGTSPGTFGPANRKRSSPRYRRPYSRNAPSPRFGGYGPVPYQAPPRYSPRAGESPYFGRSPLRQPGGGMPWGSPGFNPFGKHPLGLIPPLLEAANSVFGKSNDNFTFEYTGVEPERAKYCVLNECPGPLQMKNGWVFTNYSTFFVSDCATAFIGCASNQVGSDTQDGATYSVSGNTSLGGKTGWQMCMGPTEIPQHRFKTDTKIGVGIDMLTHGNGWPYEFAVTHAKPKPYLPAIIPEVNPNVDPLASPIAQTQAATAAAPLSMPRAQTNTSEGHSGGYQPPIHPVPQVPDPPIVTPPVRPPEPPPPGRNLPRPPGPRIREKKGLGNRAAANAASAAANGITEGKDFTEAAWRALPGNKNRRAPPLLDMMDDVWNNWPDINIGDFLANVAANEAEDRAYGAAGRFNRAATRAAARRGMPTGGGRGFQTGPLH